MKNKKAHRGNGGRESKLLSNYTTHDLLKKRTPKQNLFLPALDADLQVQYYAAKHADAEMARLEFAECFQILSEASAHFDAMQARKLKNTLAESTRFLSLKGVQE